MESKQTPVAAWIFISTVCVCAGWILSLLHALNAIGYAIFLGLCFGIAAVRFRGEGRRFLADLKTLLLQPRRVKNRRLPRVFVILAAGAFLGGELYAPTNYDGLTYRFPRILHWWMEGRWHWISTVNERMNYSGTGFEWLSLPLFIFTRSDRLFFLINLFSFLLLPGLIFSVYRQLGIPRRVTWMWMWLMPAGYCFVLQAGSIGNDTFPAVYMLAALHYALRARRSGSSADLYWGILAIALVTGSKMSNLPLILPFLIAAAPVAPLLLKRPLRTIGVLLISLLISAVPTMIANQHYSGHWTGDPLNEAKMRMTDPVAALLGNGLQIVGQNLEPPVFPHGKALSEIARDKLPKIIREKLRTGFPRFDFKWGELPQEEEAGLGFGISLLVLAIVVMIIANLFIPFGTIRTQKWPVMGMAVGAGSVAALFVYMLKIGSEAGPRLIAAYYPVAIIPLLLHPVNSWLVRRQFWLWCCAVAAASGLIGLVLTPSRPLWPSTWVTASIDPHSTMHRIQEVYAVYAERNDILAPLRKKIPPEARVIGFCGVGDEPEVALWRPFGQRRVVDFSGDPMDPWNGLAVDWSAVSGAALRRWKIDSVEALAARTNEQLVSTEQIAVRASEGPVEWHLLRAKDR